MDNQGTQGQMCINWRILVLFSVFLLLAYSNTFNASWHLDDPGNITKNPRIQIDNLYPETLHHAGFESTRGNRVFYRPATMLSFALNWYLGKTDVTGYHIVNISVHILTAFFLYLTILVLFKSPNLTGRFRENQHFIAILAAILWASNPIQIQAVTYIVQRMASMAAMFYVLGIYFFIKARICDSPKSRILLYSGVFVAFLLAVGSKENALMFPVSLLLVEMVFFRDLADPKTRKNFIWIGLLLAAGLFASGVVLFMNNGLITRLQDGYANRTFTLAERLLTEPRIVVFYISQIFYPIADRLSIVHDFEVSTGLFQPWTTFPAILFILGLVGAAFWKIRSYPLVSFAILFFFANHVIESSIIPLELVFEHRNYLPSLFLFMPVAAGLKWAIDHYKNEKPSMATVIISFVTILVMMLGIGTYVRNMVWANERTLWKDALEKAPGSARPYHNLAAGYYSKIGDYDSVEELCKKAIDLSDSSQQKAEIISLENIANAYAKRDEDYDRVIDIYNRVLSLDPERSISRFHLSLALIYNGHLDEALENINQLLSEQPEKIEYLNTKAFVLIKKHELDKALPYLAKVLQQNPDDERANLSIGLAKSLMEKYDSAEHYLTRIEARSSKKTMALLLLIENSVKAGEVQNAKKYAHQLISMSSPKTIGEKLQEANEPGMMWPVSADLVAPVIEKELKKQSDMMAKIRTGDES